MHRASVGEDEGDDDGNCVGDVDGAIDGDEEGGSVGARLGDVVGAVLGDTVGGTLGDALGDAVHGRLVHTGYWLYTQPPPLQLCAHIVSPAATHSASACANVYGRGGLPPMQPSSLLTPFT